MITIRALTTDKSILANISCDIPMQRITTLIGQSGSGKTTLLRCIAGLQKIDQGSICMQDTNLATLSAQQRAGLIGFVFQNFNLFPTMTVLENCMQPLMVVQQMNADAARLRALCMLSNLGMDAYQASYPSQLSGGQQQRVAIARALALGPKVLLLDEPSSALDPENTMILVQLLKKLCTEGITVILASQDMSFIQAVKDNVCLIQNGQVTQSQISINNFLNKDYIMKKLTILLFPLLLLATNINAMQPQVKVIADECIDECIKTTSIDELRNVRSKSKFEQRKLLKELSLSVSLNRATNMISSLNQPQVALWFTDYSGYVYQRCMIWFKNKLLKNKDLASASFWLTDLTAWCFLSKTEEALLTAKKTRSIAAKLKDGESISRDQCPFFSYESEHCTVDALKGNNRINLLRGNCFFEWLFELQGTIADLDGNIQDQLCRTEVRDGSLRFTLQQIGFESSFLNCFSNRLNKNLLDVDFSLVFPILQYLEGIYYCTQIINKAIDDGQDSCTIVFLLPNKEFTYYLIPGEAELFKSFEKNLQIILDGMNWTPIDVSVYFVPFMYGEDFYDAPYQHTNNAGRSLNRQQIAADIKG